MPLTIQQKREQHASSKIRVDNDHCQFELKRNSRELSFFLQGKIAIKIPAFLARRWSGRVCQPEPRIENATPGLFSLGDTYSDVLGTTTGESKTLSMQHGNEINEAHYADEISYFSEVTL
ncbi:hypothetical protein FQN54_006574 [Arachnomyces sp. PD_36]|nr:hypothetical protein FQN54_006574 [Arachnomyces sp. PD_36]